MATISGMARLSPKATAEACNRLLAAQALQIQCLLAALRDIKAQVLHSQAHLYASKRRRAS